MYLYGSSQHEEQRTLTTTTQYIDLAYYIHQGSNYLRFNGSGFSNTTNISQATEWAVDTNGRIYTVLQNGSTYTYYYLINDNNTLGHQAAAADVEIPASVTMWTVDSTSISNNSCYLNRSSNNTLELIQSSGATSWSIDSTANEIYSGDWYVSFNGRAWCLTRKAPDLISDGNGHYARIVGGTLSTTSDINEASDLYVSGGTLAVHTDNNCYTTYSIDEYGRILNGDEMLYFENGAFVWKDAYYYVIKTDNNYMLLNGNSLGITSDLNDATHWVFENNSLTVANGSTYLGYNRSNSWGSYSYTLAVNGSAPAWQSTDNGLYFSANSTILGGSKNYYLTYSNNSWTLNQDSGTARLEARHIDTNVSLMSSSRTPVTAYEDNTISCTANESGETTVQLSDTTYRPITVTTGSVPTAQTYFPLQIDVDESKTGEDRFSVDPLNTGYVISGYTNGFGDIRVSQYSKNNNISNSLTNNALDTAKVYTYMGGTTQTLENYGVGRFVKYDDTSAKFNESLAGNDSYVYGLHFMNASISTQNLITAPSVTINETVYENYQMPAGVRFSDDEFKVYVIPVSQTGSIEFTSEGLTVTSYPELDDTSSSETKMIETVTVIDYAGTVAARRITEGSSVTYYYGADAEHLTLSNARVCSVYFANTASDTVILQYYYYPEDTNTVQNKASPTYVIAEDITISAYDVTASASDAAVTANVTVFDTDKSYLTFQSRSDISAGDTVTIPIISP